MPNLIDRIRERLGIKRTKSGMRRTYILKTVGEYEVKFTHKDATYLWKQIKKANKKLPERRIYEAEWGGLIEISQEGKFELIVQTYNWKSVKPYYSDVGPDTVMTAHFHSQQLKNLEASLTDLRRFDKFHGQGCITGWNGFKIWKKEKIIYFNGEKKKLWSE